LEEEISLISGGIPSAIDTATYFNVPQHTATYVLGGMREDIIDM